MSKTRFSRPACDSEGTPHLPVGGSDLPMVTSQA